MVPIGLFIAAKTMREMCSRGAFEECRTKAREVKEGEMTVSRVAAVVVVAVWLLCVVFAVLLTMRVF